MPAPQQTSQQRKALIIIMIAIALACISFLLYTIFRAITTTKLPNGLSCGGCVPATLFLRSLGLQKSEKQTHAAILKRQEVEEHLDPRTWQYQSYEAFQAAITSDDPVAFPCTYATKGFKAREHRYIFLESDDMSNQRNISTLSAALQQYLCTPQSTLGPNTSLVVLFPIPSSPVTVEDYYQKYWNCLHGLRKVDPKPWPGHIPTHTDTPLWRFCFNGQPVFSAALTPAHQKRRSRYAPCFCVVFQPSFVFDILFATELKKQTAISKVRALLTEYDEVSISPELKNYGDTTGRESKQYFIMDENYAPPCPRTTLD